MNLFEKEVGVLQVSTIEKDALLVLPKPIEGKLIKPPFYGYLFGKTEKAGEQSAPMQTLELAEYQGKNVLVVATTVIDRVQNLLETTAFPMPEQHLPLFKEKVEDFENPEMGIHVITGLRLEMRKVAEGLFEKILTNARRRA